MSMSRTSATDDSANKIAIGSAAGGMLSGVGGTTITSCPASDQSFYCQFVRWFNMFKMVIFIIVFLVVLYFLYQWFVAKKK